MVNMITAAKLPSTTLELDTITNLKIYIIQGESKITQNIIRSKYKKQNSRNKLKWNKEVGEKCSKG